MKELFPIGDFMAVTDECETGETWQVINNEGDVVPLFRFQVKEHLNFSYEQNQILFLTRWSEFRADQSYKAGLQFGKYQVTSAFQKLIGVDEIAGSLNRIADRLEEANFIKQVG